jgi:hypothetical protein
MALPSPPTNIDIHVDKTFVIINYDNYTEFPPLVELLGDDFSGSNIVQKDEDQSSFFNTGFVILDLLPNTHYSGSFFLKDVNDSNRRTQNIDISFTTLGDPVPEPFSAPTNINIIPDKADAIITYDNYTEFTVDDIELVGEDFDGAGIDFLENQTDYSTGFIITGLNPNLFYNGSFILKDTLNNLRTFNVDISFTTTSEPDPPPENVNLNIDISFITITYDTYDFSDPDLIELTEGLNGLDISFLEGETDYKEGFIILNLSPNTFYSGGFILKNIFFSLTSEKTDISFTTLEEIVIPSDISGIIITPDISSVDISFNEYLDFTINTVILTDDLSGLTVNNITTTGFTLSDLSSNTTYNGGFKLVGSNIETSIADISFTTLPNTISGIIITPDISYVNISFNEYLDFTISGVILTDDLSGLTVNNITTTGFTLSDLSSNTTYNGGFKLVGSNIETSIADISFTTLPNTISGIIITPDISYVNISFNEYLDFTINTVILTDDLSGLTVNNITTTGFTLSDLSSNTTYNGGFKLVGSNIETSIADISFTTLPNTISGIIITPDISYVNISFNEYLDFTISGVILTDDLSGLTVNNITTTGFTLSDLSSNTTYNGGFKLVGSNIETSIADISFTTLPNTISGIIITPDISYVNISFNEYLDFTINTVILTDDLSGLTVNNITTTGFTLSDLSSNTTYNGGFKLVGSNIETSIADISFTTLPNTISGIIITPDISYVNISFNEYLDFTINTVILTDDLSGLTVNNITTTGFTITGLISNTIYNGGFKFVDNNLETEIADISFTTLSEPEIHVFDTINSEINNIAILDEEMMEQRKLLIINKNIIKNLLIDISNNINNPVFPMQHNWLNISNTETLIDNNVRLINEKINQISQKKKYVRNLINQIKIENLTEPIPVRDPKLKYYYDKFIRK